jgi:sugar/nucleoside kinase (ribokinase family)
LYISIGSVIVDDIVLPDGKTYMGMFGGGSTHAIAGMRVWADQVGLVSWVGDNFPDDMKALLQQEFDLRGVVRRHLATPRAWQVFEWDNKRTEIFRTSMDEFVFNSPKPAELPLEYNGAAGVHLQCEVHHFHEWVNLLRGHGTRVIVWEPWGELCTQSNRAIFRELMPLVDAISPNLLEAKCLTGQEEPVAIAQAMLEDGARLVALRMGAEGSLVMGKDFQPVRIPAVQVEKIVDVTGAGNAYCGGFVVGLAETGDPLQAGCWGAVSGSFALEQFGALYPFEGVRSKALQRLDVIKGALK